MAMAYGVDLLGQTMPLAAIPVPPRTSGPRRTVPIPVLRMRAGWVTFGLLAFGLVMLGYGLVMLGESLSAASARPGALTMSMLLFGVHGLVFFLVVRGLDFPTPRSRLLLAAALIWGGVVATSLSLSLETWLGNLLAAVASQRFVADWGTVLTVPITEEGFKLLGVMAIVLLAPRQVNRATDGLMYGAVVGLGFEEIENAMYAVQAAAAGNTGAPVIGQFLVRGLVSGWGLHIAWSAVAGAGAAWAYLHRDRPPVTRVAIAGLAFLVACGLHGWWDSPLATFTSGGGPLLGMAVAVAPFVVVAIIAVRGQAGFAVRRLGELRNPVVATPAELAALGSPYRRYTARWNAYVRAGLGAARTVRQLQRAQAGLAMALARAEVPAVQGPVVGDAATRGGDVAPAELAEAEKAVLATRELLSANGIWEASGGSPATGLGWLALAAGLAGPVVMQALLVFNAGAQWSTAALLGTMMLLGGLAAVPLLLCNRTLRRGRGRGAPVDVRLGIGVLPGVAGFGLALLFLVTALGLG